MLVRFETWLTRVLTAIAYAGGLVLVGLAVLILYEIGARYFFGRPFRGGFEMTELAMSVVVACGLPYTAITRGHVAVDVFAKWLDRPAMRWLTCAVHATGAAVLAIVFWQSLSYAVASHQYGDVSNMMRIPKSPFQFAVAISAGLFSLVLLLEALKALRPPEPPSQTGA